MQSWTPQLWSMVRLINTLIDYIQQGAAQKLFRLLVFVKFCCWNAIL